MPDLRARAIRLAYAKPELRDLILPLVAGRQAAIFEAPPAVVEAVYNWGMPLLCARWLNRLEEKRAEIHAKIEEADSDWARKFQENRLLNYKLVEKEARKWVPGSTRQGARWQHLTMLEPDFKGWRYLREIEKRTGSTPAQLLEGRAERTYTIKLEEQKVRLDGSWHLRDFRLFLTLSFDVHDIATYRKRSAEFHELIVHEVAHLGQSYLQLLLGLGNGVGLLNPSMAEPGYSPEGMPLGKGGPKEEHALREVEFYTRLQDEVTKFLRVVPSIPKSGRREAIKVWVGASQPPRGLTFRPTVPKGQWAGAITVRFASFFEALWDNNRAKWRKAVSEFVRAVERKVQIP